ncbi:MAG: hypothetical protein ACLGHN_01215 [Bacteriovoracia bacterium]
MDTIDKYRSSSDYREILRILQKSTTQQENFLWQTDSEGNRNIIPIHHFEIDFVAREVVIYFDSEKFQIRKDLSLYVKLDYKTSVFKVSDFRVGQNSIHFAFPYLIKTLELRSFPRHRFLPNNDHTITIKPSLTGGRESSELQVRLIDISRYGAGLVISELNRSFLKNNRILWVTRLGEERLQHPVLAEVVYINSEVDPRFQTRKQKELKVGLKLSGIFPKDVYSKFIL